MKTNMQRLLYITLVYFIFHIFFGSGSFLAYGVDDDDLNGKIMCGYQGWFGAPGDDILYGGAWYHWCINEEGPTPATIAIDTWPDYSEYPEHTLYYPYEYTWYYPNGKRAGFFSSNDEETVLLHCKWMRDYGIDGVFLQRFTTGLTNNMLKARYDNVLKYMLKGAEMYGLKVVVMYDVTGTLIWNIPGIIAQDWRDLVNRLNVTNDPGYLHHKDKKGEKLPLVGVWGFGFFGNGMKEISSQVIDFFKNNENTSYRATLLGGVPGYWRLGILDSKANYDIIYSSYDIISPWTVGRFHDQETVEQWRRDLIDGDMWLTADRGQDYMPVCFPGFSISNLRRINGESQEKENFNEIPRDGGHFMWSQFYHWRQAGAGMLYIAMFDEVDEGTAIFKIAPNAQHVPTTGNFVHLGTDGYQLKSDHYLWMTGTAGFILKQNLPFPKTQPSRIANEAFHGERHIERAWLIDVNYTKITVAINNNALLTTSIYKKEGNGEFTLFKQFQQDEFLHQTVSFIDTHIDANTQYTYLLVGFDGNGIPIAFSNRIIL